MRLRWTRRAESQLLEIGRYIARDKPGAARSWVEALRRRAVEAADHPLAGRRVPEIGREDVREVVLRGYRIVYRVADEAIVVLTVFDGRRLLKSALAAPDPVDAPPER